MANDTPLPLKGVYDSIRNRFYTAGIESADLEARIILETRAYIEWADLIAQPEMFLEPLILDLIEDDVARRLTGEPLGRIYNKREFRGLDFCLSPDTLEPRPDSEVLVEHALKNNFSPKRILDLGTGSGCLLIALLDALPSAKGVGIDLSLGAVQTAQINAQINDVANRAWFICGSWLDSVSGQFDLIVSNPPYIANQVIPTLAKEVQEHDPILGLDGGFDGLQPYRAIFSELKSFLAPDGKALFEIGFDQGDSVMRLAENSGLYVVGVWPDYAGQPRVVEISNGDK